MKILLTHAYAKDNKGDAAIISVLLRQLNGAFPAANITISIYDDDTKYKDFEGYKVLSNSMYISVYRFKSMLLKSLYALYIEGSLLLWALLYRLCGYSMASILPKNTRDIAHEYLQSDLFVPVGGGYLRTKKGIQGTVDLLFLLNPLIIGILLKKPIILYTQSIGPFATSFQGRITAAVLNRTQAIFVREGHTLLTLKRIGVNAKIVIRTTDAGFLFASDKEFHLSDIIEDTETLRGKTLVGVTVRKWLEKEGQANFERAVAQFIDRLTEDRNMHVLFIPQVTSTTHKDDDRDVAKRIVGLVTNQQQVTNCTGAYDHYELKRLYSYLDFLVGTRFHSVIFALTSYIPALAIEYEYKTSGIMSDLGLAEWVIPMEQVTTDNLYEKFEQLLNEADCYKQNLQDVLPAYILKAKEVEKQMQDVYCSFKLTEQ